MRRVLLYLLVVMILSSISISVGAQKAGSIKCAYCKKPVATAQYIILDSLYFCENHFICTACGKSIGLNTYKSDGKGYYHPTCYDSAFAILCHQCGGAMTGKYTIFEGKSYHDSCYTNHIALRCAHCRDLIVDEYIYDYWGNKYHSSHDRTEPKCGTCNRFVSSHLTQGGVKAVDGRWSCGICLQTSIKSDVDVRRLFDQTKEDLARLGIEIPFKEVTIQLLASRTDFPQGARHSGTVWGHAEYRYIKAMYGLLPVASDVNIYLLDNLPEMFARSVIAHEMMHLWLFRNGKRNADPALVEGTCNYAAWLVLQAYAGKERDYLLLMMEKEPDKVYGEGFRRVRTFANTQSMESFLAFLEKNKRLPKGY